jgi:hypothetical protein
VSSALPPKPETNYFQGFAWAMYGNAYWQLTQDQYTAAVLLSQVAVEMGAWNAFTSLLVRRHGEIDDAFFKRTVPDLSFMEQGTRRLWTELTGESVTGEPRDIWKAYHAHVEYRNRIAHGRAWGDSNAHASWRAAGEFIARLDGTMARVDAQDEGLG